MMAEELRHHLTEFDIVVHQEDCRLFASAVHDSRRYRTVAAGGVTSQGRGRNLAPSGSRGTA